MSIFITKSVYWIHISSSSSSSDMIIHPLKVCLKTVLKSLDHEQGNCFLLENLWLMDVISIDLKNFCLFFLSKNLTMLMQGNKNIKEWNKGNPLVLLNIIYVCYNGNITTKFRNFLNKCSVVSRKIYYHSHFHVNSLLSVDYSCMAQLLCNCNVI